MSAMRRLGPALAVVVCVTCLGCGEHSTDPTLKQIPAQSAQPPTATPEAPTRPLVEVTQRAVKRLKEIIESQGITETWALRLQATWPRGICSPQHKLDLDTNLASSSDTVFESGSIRVIVLKRQADMLRDAQVDFGEKDGQQGFLVNNPNFEGELLKKWGPIVAADPLSAGK